MRTGFGPLRASEAGATPGSLVPLSQPASFMRKTASMYEAFFHLRKRPFTAAPHSDCFFPAPGIEAARRTLARIIGRGEGAGLIIGPSGTGKTLLCQALAAAFQDRLSTALLSSGRICTRRALLQAILFELRLPYRGMEEGELRLALIDHLTPGPGGHPGLLLMVDEAHTLPLRLLEELRMITNLARDGEPRVRLILAGSPALEERFASPKLDSFSQRLAARCYLSALTREETTGYARYQVTAAGGDPDRVFEPSAYESIFRAADGIPRLVNQVCDHALILTALGEGASVTGDAIEEAWSDLQQLPTPWHSDSQQGDSRAAVVEFAALDETLDAGSALRFPAPSAPHPVQSPEDQLERIQRHLSEVDDDFQPAGSIGPELELVFNDNPDPFGEAFDEEEVVIDRYASLEADLFAERPLVNSREGTELSHLLTPWMNKAPAPTLSMQFTGQANPRPEHEKPSTPVEAEAYRDTESLDNPAAPSTHAGPSTQSAYGEAEWRRDEHSQSPVVESPTGAPPALPIPEGILEDADLIVIDDDFAGSVQNAPPPLVRRQEYRQLFAKLRRG